MDFEEKLQVLLKPVEDVITPSAILEHHSGSKNERYIKGLQNKIKNYMEKNNLQVMGQLLALYFTPYECSDPFSQSYYSSLSREPKNIVTSILAEYGLEPNTFLAYQDYLLAKDGDLDFMRARVTEVVRDRYGVDLKENNHLQVVAHPNALGGVDLSIHPALFNSLGLTPDEVNSALSNPAFKQQAALILTMLFSKHAPESSRDHPPHFGIGFPDTPNTPEGQS